MSGILARANIGSKHREKFIEDILENLDSNRYIFNLWVEFFEESHGEIFEKLDYKNPKKQAFAHTVYYDYIVDSLIKRMEDIYNFTLDNKSSSDNNMNIDFSIRDVYPTNSNYYNQFNNLDTEAFDDLDADSLRKIQKELIPKDLRLALGEFHTPLSVCKMIIENISNNKVNEESFMDPGSGSGTFVSACIEKKIENGDVDNIKLDNILNNVYAIDLNPISVKSTKLSYLIAVSDLIENSDVQSIELPVFLKDALELTRDDHIVYENNTVDLTVENLIGNPPYITWDNLPDNVKTAWIDKYIDSLNLLPKEGVDKRLGHANDDISVPYVWVCIYKYLEDNGSATFIMKRDLMKGTSGELFRKMKVGDINISLEWVIDFNKLRPFGSSVQVDVATYNMNKSNTTNYPVLCKSVRSKDSRKTDFSSEESISNTLEFDNLEYLPISQEDPSSILVDKKIGRKVLGECEYDIRHGVKGDKKSVFKINDETLEDIENNRVYPYVTSRHIVKFGIFGTPDRYLLPIDKTNETNLNYIKNKLPKTYKYLDSNRSELESRSSSWLDDGEFYNMFGVGDYTWMNYKVCWCRLGYKPHFAVFSDYEDPKLGEKMIVPGDHYMYIPVDNRIEAHYINGLLNADPYQKAISAISSRGKSSITKSVVNRLKIPKFEGSSLQERIAKKSIECAKIVKSESKDMSKRSYNSTKIDELEEKKSTLSDMVNDYTEKKY